MTYTFSGRSRRELNSCHSDLQKVFAEVIRHWDCTILIGHRTQLQQMEAHRTGNSNVEWPDSLHNKVPSLAVDAVPYPIDWNDLERFRAFGGFVLGVSTMMGITLRWGGDWDGDRSFKDQLLVDLPHYELVVG